MALKSTAKPRKRDLRITNEVRRAGPMVLDMQPRRYPGVAISFGEAGVIIRCSRQRLVVPSREYGIDQGYNQTHKSGGCEQVVRGPVSGRYRSNCLHGAFRRTPEVGDQRR